jgi:hypothetical protein
MNKKQPEQKLFCKLCLDNGQPMTTVTSHNVIGLNGKSCCPTKAGLECRKCGRNGHFAKYCTASMHVSDAVMKSIKKASEKASEKPAEKPVVKGLSKSTNLFAELEESSDEESPRTPKKEKVVDAECPGAPSKTERPVKPKPVDWADWSDSEDEE